MDTLLLNRDNWDIFTDASGNIALATDPYSRVQDVASACRLFIGELWYDTSKGIPYFQQVLGQMPPMSLVKDLMVKSALTVPGVVSAQCVITGFSNRTISGQIQFIDVDGAANNVTF